MVKMLFYMQFRSQLVRTRPELVAFLESALTAGAAASGGVVETGRKVLSASFDEDRIGFWLDMVVFLDRVYRDLTKAAGELYGYALMLGRDVNENAVRKLCRSASGQNVREHSGIWCSAEIRKTLEFYAVFDRPAKAEEAGIPPGASELKKFRPLNRSARKYPYRDKIKALAQTDGKNTLFLGPDIEDLRDGVYHYSAALLGDTPPLAIRFGSAGLACFADAFTPGIRSFLSARVSAETLRELDALHSPLFMERLRREWSPYTREKCRLFVRALLRAYRAAVAGRRAGAGILILEDIGQAGSGGASLSFGRESAIGFFTEIYASMTMQRPDDPAVHEFSPEKDKNSAELLVIGTGDSRDFADGVRNDWAGVFSRVLKFTPENTEGVGKVFDSGFNTVDLCSDLTTPRPARESVQRALNPSHTIIPAAESSTDTIPPEIREVAYNISLLGRYFPAYLFPRLFEEEGLNREMYFLAEEMLHSFFASGFDAAVSGENVPRESRPESSAFASRAEKILGENADDARANDVRADGSHTDDARQDKVRSAVRGRLLHWVLSGKIKPCFGFLKSLSELGGTIPDALVLTSLRADVRNGTWEEIDRAIADGTFAAITGEGNAPLFGYIYETLKTLVWGGRGEIERVFGERLPPVTMEDEHPRDSGCRAQALTNLASFYLGERNTEAALEAARKALLLNRDTEGGAVPAYRLFSLANILRQRVDDAMEYISYALEQAGKSGQNEETILAGYYAASIHLLYGNLSKAGQLAAKTEETALNLGQPEWGKKARFLRGRLCFEIGRYGEALEFFESLVEERGSPGRDGLRDDAAECAATMRTATMRAAINAAVIMREATIRAWIFRTKNFLGRFTSREEGAALTGFDARLFEMEAAYFATDYKRTVALADEFLLSRGDDSNDSDSGESKEGFIFTEQPDWRSGFSQCEFMFQSEKAWLARQARIYRAMAECALNPPRERRLKILGRMQRFMREELLPDTDPADAFSFYAWYCMLRDTKAAQVDMNTIVSMAFKRLQRRAARIDDTAARQAFLNLSRWNNALCLAAREYKLV